LVGSKWRGLQGPKGGDQGKRGEKNTAPPTVRVRPTDPKQEGNECDPEGGERMKEGIELGQNKTVNHSLAQKRNQEEEGALVRSQKRGGRGQKGRPGGDRGDSPSFPFSEEKTEKPRNPRPMTRNGRGKKERRGRRNPASSLKVLQKSQRGGDSKINKKKKRKKRALMECGGPHGRPLVSPPHLKTGRT